MAWDFYESILHDLVFNGIFFFHQSVKVIAKVRASATPEERYRKPFSGNTDSEVFEQYYGAKKRIQTTLKRAKPLSSMRRPAERPKLTAMLAQKRERLESHVQISKLFQVPQVSHPAAEWGML